MVRKMKLNLKSIKDNGDEWRRKGFKLPEYDVKRIAENTAIRPEWIHFGGGNIFRAYIALLADELIGKGLLDTGIIAVDNFGTEPVEKIYRRFDNLILLVGLRAKGERYLRVLGSVAEALAAADEGMERLKRAAENPSLKMISYTITEKGYSVMSADKELLPDIRSDIEAGPSGKLKSVLGKTAALLHQRFMACGLTLSLVSMDNCHRNGHKLRDGVMAVAKGWVRGGLAGQDFLQYLCDNISFPCTMIDKITPRPDPAVAEELKDLGIEDMQPIVTKRGTYLAPFVNAEMPQYLVVEELFPGGRPPLEKAGVYFADIETVDKAEKMKVAACLNPLHTSLAVFGCLLGYKKISDEMEDPILKKLVYSLAYDEGLPVVSDPLIIKPEDFLREVLTERLPNANLPDTPARIAADTSQKLSVRFGETVREHMKRGDADRLKIVPLVIAGWLRYLTGINDQGEVFELSPDPELEGLGKIITPEMYGKKELSPAEKAGIEKLLKNKKIFGTDLKEAGLAERISDYFSAMLRENGAVRRTLEVVLSE